MATSVGKLKGPLAGLRVLEVGQLIAGPFTTTLLGYYGAEVIKIESPNGGDPIRKWRELDSDGVSPWWRSIARNKKSVCVDFKSEAGRRLIHDLANKSDVLVENFKPGTMEKWSLGPGDFKHSNPKLIYTRVSGYGQTGPYSSRAGYASVCEAMGGFRYVNGHAGETPIRPNISLGDSLAGLHAAFGVVLALLARTSADQLRQSGQPGQVVDVAIYESVFNMMEGIVPEYDRMGKVREPSGTTVTGIVPTNTYPTLDGSYVVIGGNGDSIFKRLMKAAGREDMANNPLYENNNGRVKHQQDIDTAIADWTKTLSREQVLEALETASVPAGLIYNVKDIVADPQYQARDMLEQVHSNGRPLKIPAIVPKLQSTPGETKWAGPELGEHTRQVLSEVLGLTKNELDQMESMKIISSK